MEPIKSTAEFLGEREQNLSAKAYDAMLQMLISRELPPNTVLQERRLAELLNISRTPVRDALTRLENEGLISRTAGRTLVVRQFSIRELIETLHVRRTLEAEAARLAAGRVPATELDEMETSVRRLLDAEVPNAEEDWIVDSKLHQMLSHYSGNLLLTQYIETLRLKTRMFNLSVAPERFESAHQEHLAIVQALKAGYQEHLAIIEALRSGDGDAAQKAAAAHIDSVRQSIINRFSHL
ncbi:MULTISPECIES: GntR family transcriptional regulator [unclassified Pseudomonas]|uniref:GntR family transcriptional regulator n=1 Tax=unclassified Pseudomonas TaxID=196821 RepID=UPI00131B40FF|nr:MULTISPECIES: GntR family transcriptional regulator [unclassified Pseudomonas]